MKLKNYIIIRHSDGRCKVYTAEQYRLRHVLKSIGMILGALLMAVLFCGAAITSEHPAKVAQAVFLFGASVFVVVATIVFCVTGGEKK